MAAFHELGDHFAIDLPGARALFTTRRGGHSHGPYRSLNLGTATDDEPERVRLNHLHVESIADRPLAHCRQVHGTHIEHVTGPVSTGLAPQADGQVTTSGDVAPMVLVADCLPVVVAAPGAVAVLHAGWRGLAGGILADGVARVRALAGDGAMAAAIGPGAGGCCYEVGEEVHGVFAARHPSARRARRLDLKSIAREQLLAAGVGEVHDLRLCTLCADPGLFFSHRRDRGVTGRQAGVAWLV